MARRPVIHAYALGVLVASCVLAALLAGTQKAGVEQVARKERTTFAVAMLAGEKQEAQTPPENTAKVLEQVQPVEKSSEVAAAKRETSLPQATTRAPANIPKLAEPEPIESPKAAPVPSVVAMPGGALLAEDVAQGDIPALAAPAAQVVYVRLLIDAQSGKVVSGLILRPGPSPMRDAMMLKDISSRTFNPRQAGLSPESQGVWQLDLALDYRGAPPQKL